MLGLSLMGSTLRPQGAKPLVNLADDPAVASITSAQTAGKLGWTTTRWYGGTGSAGTYERIVATDAPTGLTAYIRKTWTAIAGNGDLGIGLSGGATSAVSTTGIPLKPSTTYTFSGWLRCSTNYGASGSASGAQIDIWEHDATGAFVARPVSLRYGLVAGIWSKLSLTFTTSATTATAGFVLDIDGVAPTVGMTLDGTGIMLVEGVYTGVYCDGNTPSWRWIGVEGASQSVGYPYTLESIAGAPDLDVANTTVQALTLPAVATPTTGRSFYVVSEILSQSNLDGNPLFRYGNLVGEGDNAGTFLPRIDTITTTPVGTPRIASNGISNLSGGAMTAPYIGQHTMSLVVSNGFTETRRLIDSTNIPTAFATSATFQSGGMGTVFQQPGTGLSSARKLTHVLIYQREHDTMTQQRIMAWLARRYNSPVS